MSWSFLTFSSRTNGDVTRVGVEHFLSRKPSLSRNGQKTLGWPSLFNGLDILDGFENPGFASREERLDAHRQGFDHFLHI